MMNIVTQHLEFEHEQGQWNNRTRNQLQKQWPQKYKWRKMDKTKTARTNSVLDRLAWKGPWLPHCTSRARENVSESQISSDLLRSPKYSQAGRPPESQDVLSDRWSKSRWLSCIRVELSSWDSSWQLCSASACIMRTTRTVTLAMTWCRDMPSLRESDNPKGPTCWAAEPLADAMHLARSKMASFKAAVTAVSTQCSSHCYRPSEAAAFHKLTAFFGYF